MLVTDAAQFLHELSWSRHIAAFALDWFDKNRGDFFRRKHRLEQAIFNMPRALQSEVRIAIRKTVNIGILNVCYSRRRRPETAALLRFGCGQRERAHGATVERAEEGDHVLPLGVIAS